MADRPPGVRAIILRDNRILLNREYRYEMEDWDYRLPGGKVFDSRVECDRCYSDSELWDTICQQLRNELREETDIEIHSAKFLGKDSFGFTIQWDLYYFLVEDFEVNSTFYDTDSQKSEFEFIEHKWTEKKGGTSSLP